MLTLYDIVDSPIILHYTDLIKPLHRNKTLYDTISEFEIARKERYFRLKQLFEPIFKNHSFLKADSP